jgi:pyridinium-3,5-biscarboxylic acid mononucleotide sulfurtransferase
VRTDPSLLALRRAVEPLGSAVVAFSGGIDSALVLAVAAERTNAPTVALTAVSPSLSQRELEGAQAFARSLGVRHLLIETRELDDPDYARNPTNRCYFCKRELYARCFEIAAGLGFEQVLDGFNADDAHDHRPGRQAALEREVRSPLVEAGLDKAAVRAAARALGLPIWDKPASPCLSSRLPYGTAVTVERLAQIEAAEAALRSFGFLELRVRHLTDGLGDVARVEVAEAELPRLLVPELRRQVEDALRAVGYRSVAVDPRPFRSGRMNEGLVTLGGRQQPAL